MRRWVPLMLVSLVGCTPPSMLQCGPGTHQEGAFCVADDVTPPSLADAGATLSDAGFSDAGPNDGGDGDAGHVDAGPSDAGLSDAGATDAGFIDSGALDSGPADAGLTDSGVVPPRLDGGALADGGFVAATDWSTTRGPALASHRVGTFAIGNGTILRVLPHGLILAEGSNCTGPGGPCTIRWVDDSGATLVSYASATQPQFVDDAQGSRAFLVANGTALTCSGMFVAYRLTGTALAVDTETGQPLHTLMNDAVAIEFSPGSQWVRARTRDAQMPCTFAGTAAWHDTRPPYATASTAVSDAITRAAGIVINDHAWVVQIPDGGVLQGDLGVFDSQTQATTSLGRAPTPLGGTTLLQPLPRGQFAVSTYSIAGAPRPVSLFDVSRPGPIHQWVLPSNAGAASLYGTVWSSVLTPITGSRRTQLFHDATGRWPDRSVETSTSNFLELTSGVDQFTVTFAGQPNAWVLNLNSNTAVDLGLPAPFTQSEQLTEGALLQPASGGLFFVHDTQMFGLGPSPDDLWVQWDRALSDHSHSIALLHRADLDGETIELFDAVHLQRTVLTHQGNAGYTNSPGSAPGWPTPWWLEASADTLIGFSERHVSATTDTQHYFTVPWHGGAPPREFASFSTGTGASGRARRSPDGSRLAVGWGPSTAMEIWVGPAN